MQFLTLLSKSVIALNLLALLVYVNPLVAFLSALIMGGAYTLIYVFFKSKLYFERNFANSSSYNQTIERSSNNNAKKNNTYWRLDKK